MTSVRAKKRRRAAAIAALLCALVASLAIVVAPAAAEEGDSAPLRPASEFGLSFGEIRSVTYPEEYPLQFELGEEQFMRQVDEQEVVVEYTGHFKAFSIKAPLEHDAEGANVPTTLKFSGGDVVTFVVHHRGGNPAAGGAPFVYPITGGAGWLGGFHTTVAEMNNPQGPPADSTPSEPPPTCVVPALHDLSLHAAKARLRAAHCSIGQVRLATGATAAKGKVAKQFRAAGTELPAGAPVAVKLAAPGSL
jgi:hypothetical protein